jgi:hypothetical protein
MNYVHDLMSCIFVFRILCAYELVEMNCNAPFNDSYVNYVEFVHMMLTYVLFSCACEMSPLGLERVYM